VSTLAGVQRDFLAALLEESTAQDARLAIYQRAVFSNWEGALASAYPVTRRLVGAAFFREAAQRFARASASTSGDLNDFGAGFAEFLAGYEHAAGLDYLADVARLEWALHESHRAEEAPACDFIALSAVAPDRQGAIRFKLHPAVRLVASPHPIVAIWEANQPGRDGTLARRDGPDHVLVRRAGPIALDAREWAFLDSIRRGASLDEASAELDDDSGEALDSALARLAGEGVACGFELPG